MIKSRRRTKPRRTESGALQILEEAFHLVRTGGLRSFWIYYLGAVPWSLGLLYFVADMSRSSLAGRDAALAALGLTGLWLWLRAGEARYCAELRRRLEPGGAVARTRWETFRALAALWCAQAFRLPMLVAGLVFAVPFGWIYATRQNFAALALSERLGEHPFRQLLGRSVRLSHDQWAQNHGILVIFSFVALFTWVNLMASCLVVPGLVKSFLGVESLFTLSPQAAIFNTTFLLGSLLLVRLALGPLVLAAYTLRCFYAASRTSGADLLGRLEACRERREREARRDRGLPGRVAALVLLSGFVLCPVAPAEEAAPARAERDGSEIEAYRTEIAATLEQKKYQWQLSRREAEEEEKEESWLARRLGEIAESVKAMLAAMERWFEEQMRKLFDRNLGGGGRDPSKESDFFKRLGSTTSLALVAVVLGLVVWLAVVLYRRHRGREKVVEVNEGAGGPVDLESEDIVATQLHEDEWLRLAREQIGKGEERLAIRALFLATLAHLGERGLLRIARFKSNRDYRTELVLRARPLDRLRGAFDENTQIFERAWYGLHRLGPGAVEEFLANHGLIAAETARVKPGPAPTNATARAS